MIDEHFAALEALAELKWSSIEQNMLLFMKNEQFSTPEKIRNPNKTQL